MSKRADQLAAMRHVADTAKALLAGTVDMAALREAVALWDVFRPMAFRRRDAELALGGRGGHAFDCDLTPTRTSTQGKILKSTTTRVSANFSAKSGPTWLSPFAAAWRQRFGASPAWGQLAKALKPLLEEHGDAEVLRRWENYLLGSGAQYASAARFAVTFGAWKTPTPDAWRTDPTEFRPGESQEDYIQRQVRGTGR